MLLPKFLSRKISPETSLDFLSQKSVLRPALGRFCLAKMKKKTMLSNKCSTAWAEDQIFFGFSRINSSEQDFKDLYWTISKILFSNLFTWKGIYLIDWVGRIHWSSPETNTPGTTRNETFHRGHPRNFFWLGNSKENKMRVCGVNLSHFPDISCNNKVREDFKKRCGVQKDFC